MKELRFTPDALRDLRRLKGAGEPIVAKLERYAATGAGDVSALAGALSGTRRLRIGDYRAIFEETAERLLVTRVGHRRDIYD